jgi:hypothetical protein
LREDFPASHKPGVGGRHRANALVLALAFVEVDPDPEVEIVAHEVLACFPKCSV